MGIFAKGKDVPKGVVDMQLVGGVLSTQQVVGTSCSMMVAMRSAGYHSKPHVHDCEQLNYVSRGEIWVFVEDDAFELKMGDFLRIPPSKVHWAWNRADQDCELIECHSPGLDILPEDQAVFLLSDKEDRRSVRRVGTTFPEGNFVEVETKILKKKTN
ncbi:MAG TPA: cupin domain-containing protein [Desulfatiglandales bacterium]|nr:cupin domain-containing protein [Desulfatiglandales bacterium]